jgi:hypothetical protein
MASKTVVTRRLRVEHLEDRAVPAIFGQIWPNLNITISFAPDGTLTPNGPSNLFASLNALMPQQVWQQTILEAFAAWDDVAPISFQVVADGGQAAGTPGYVQGDSRFGDIRIYGASLGPEVLSVTVPYDGFISGTLAGDIVINTDIEFTPARLKTAMLQEVGHALGLDNSLDPQSVMYEWEHGATQLAPSDIFAIQALYGMNANSNPLEQLAGSIAPSAVATQTLQAPMSSGTTLTLSVVLPQGGSMPGVVVLDALQQPVATEVLVTNTNQFTLRVANVSPGMTYTVQLISTDVSAPTSYLLLSQFSQQPAALENFYQDHIPVAGTLDVRLRLQMPIYFQFSLQAYQQDVTLRIRDASGSVLSTWTVPAGQIKTAPTLFLLAGEYTLEFDAAAATDFRLFGMDLSDPIGVRRPGSFPTNGPVIPPPPIPSPSPPPPPPPPPSSPPPTTPPENPPPPPPPTPYWKWLFDRLRFSPW